MTFQNSLAADENNRIPLYHTEWNEGWGMQANTHSRLSTEFSLVLSLSLFCLKIASWILFFLNLGQITKVTPSYAQECASNGIFVCLNLFSGWCLNSTVFKGANRRRVPVSIIGGLCFLHEQRSLDVPLLELALYDKDHARNRIKEMGKRDTRDFLSEVLGVISVNCSSHDYILQCKEDIHPRSWVLKEQPHVPRRRRQGTRLTPVWWQFAEDHLPITGPQQCPEIESGLNFLTLDAFPIVHHSV